MRTRYWIMCLLCWSLFSGGSQPSSAQKMSEADRKALFAWFDSMEFPNLKGRPLVRTLPEPWNHEKGNHIDGFLIRDTKDEVTIFNANLYLQTYSKKKTGLHAPTKLIKLDLKQWSKDVLAGKTYPVDPRFIGSSELYSLICAARANEANGNFELAKRLCDKALIAGQSYLNIGQPIYLNSPSKPKIDTVNFFARLRPALMDQLSRGAIWRATLDIGEAEISWEELLRTFKTFVRMFPKSGYLSQAKKTIATLALMVVEEQEHTRRTTKPFQQMTPDEQVDELIFQLRTQNGHQYIQPGICNIFDDWRAEESPASQLVKIGIKATPALIKVLEDERLTRSIQFGRSFAFSHRALTVGEAANQVLYRISGKYFQSDKAGTSVQKAKEWWEQVQKRGIKATLVEQVESGGTEASNQVDRLMTDYPVEAVPAILKGVAKAKEAYVRKSLIESASRSKNPVFTPLFRQRLKSDEALGVRLASAKALLQQGEQSALRAMVAEWKTVSPSEGRDAYDLDELIQFLIESKQAYAVTELGKHWSTYSLYARLRILMSVPLSASPQVEAERDWQEALDTLLTKAILDTSIVKGYIRIGSVSFSDPRLCDVAAQLFSLRYPNRYQFEEKGSLAQRNRQRHRILEQWKREKRLPPQK